METMMFIFNLYISAGLALAIMARLLFGPAASWLKWVGLALFWPVIIFMNFRCVLLTVQPCTEFWAQDQEGDPWVHYCEDRDRFYTNGRECAPFDIAAVYERAFAVAEYDGFPVSYQPRPPLKRD